MHLKKDFHRYYKKENPPTSIRQQSWTRTSTEPSWNSNELIKSFADEPSNLQHRRTVSHRSASHRNAPNFILINFSPRLLVAARVCWHETGAHSADWQKLIHIQGCISAQKTSDEPETAGSSTTCSWHNYDRVKNFELAWLLDATGTKTEGKRPEFTID